MTKKSADINYISKDLLPKTYNRTMIEDYYIKQLEQENKQLKDNWNKLIARVINRFNGSQDVQFLDVLQDMQELEQGSDSNVKD